MVSRIHQETTLPHGSVTVVNNTYPNRRVVMKDLPPNSNVVIKKKILSKNLKARMAEIKSSNAYRKGYTKYKSRIKSSIS